MISDKDEIAIQLPLFKVSADSVVSPNVLLRSALFAAIRSNSRENMKHKVIFSQSGYEIQYTGEQLNGDDLDVWMAVVDLVKNYKLNENISISGSDILSRMGKSKGGDQYESLFNSLIRMTACAVVIKFQDRKYFGSLIHAGILDESTKKYKIKLNKDIVNLFYNNDWTGIDMNIRKLLRQKPLALKLSEYYSSHSKPVPVSLDFIYKITGSQCKDKDKFKQLIKKALNELVKVNFLINFEFKNNLVIVNKSNLIKKIE